jgi:hypothetical protein
VEHPRSGTKVKSWQQSADSFFSGEGGIRTHGDPKATTVFETAPIGRSGTSPTREDYTSYVKKLQ